MVYSAEGAVKFATKVDGAAVVKPIKGSCGRGVTMEFESEEEIIKAYEQTKASIGVLATKPHV